MLKGICLIDVKLAEENQLHFHWTIHLCVYEQESFALL